MLLPPDLVEAPGCLEPRERDRPLSFHWRTVDFERIQALGVPHHKDKDRNAARNSILAEAILAHDENRWVSYARRKEFYVGRRRYHGTAYSYATIIPAVDELRDLELIEEQRSVSGQRGQQSRFRATPRLIEGLAGSLFEHELRGLIRLKDADGKLIDFRESSTTLRMSRELEALNEFLGTIDLHLTAPDAVRTVHHLIDGAHYRPTPKPGLYRVFNRGSFSMGGRAYGWWQSLSKQRRRQLLLNGEPTAEPDFIQMHPSILYALRGHRLEGDAYETGEFSREEGKLAFNVALNAKTRQGAISALRNKPDWPHDGQRTTQLIENLKRRNAPIADDLHADRGVRLMRLDSDITLEAVRECAKAAIPVLPVHDSMLTLGRYEGRVAEIMEASAANRLKAISPCRVKVSGYAVPQMPSGFFSLLPLPSSPLASLDPISAFPEPVPVQLDLFPTAPLDTFTSGAELRRLRENLSLTQEQAALRLHYRNRSTIANAERDHDRLSRQRVLYLRYLAEPGRIAA